MARFFVVTLAVCASMDALAETDASIVKDKPYSLIEKVTTTRVVNGQVVTEVLENYKMRDFAGRIRFESGHLEGGAFVADSILLTIF